MDGERTDLRRVRAYPVRHSSPTRFFLAPTRDGQRLPRWDFSINRASAIRGDNHLSHSRAAQRFTGQFLSWRSYGQQYRRVVLYMYPSCITNALRRIFLPHLYPPHTRSFASGRPVSPREQLSVHAWDDAGRLSAAAEAGVALHAEGLPAPSLPVGEDGRVETWAGRNETVTHRSLILRDPCLVNGRRRVSSQRR